MAKRSAIEVLDAERAFNIDELFFSITDKKGIILRCNEVFTRISAYPPAEVLGAPHSILRHPDMPRAVFKLMWDTIAVNKTIAAYVKNLAKDGRYYWVLAVVMPTTEGYLSIRLKPTSPMLNVVRGIYSEMLSVERVIETDAKRRPEAMAASTKHLEQLLTSHGFHSYEAFMQTALTSEMIARQQALQSRSNKQNLHLGESMRDSDQFSGSERHSFASGRHMSSDFDYAAAARMREVATHFAELDQNLQKLFEYLDAFRSMNVMLRDKSRSMLDNAAVIRLLSLNATVAAHRLGASALTLGVVAESLGEASVNSEKIITELSREMDSLVETLSSLIFEVATIKLQSEVSNCFFHEMEHGEGASALDDVTGSITTLVREVSNRTSAVYEQLTASEMCFAVLRKRIEHLLCNVNTLRFVQFAGLKESVSLNGAEAFAVVFKEAKLQIDKTRSECDQLSERVEAIQNHIRTIRSARSGVIAHAVAMSNWTESLPTLYS